MNRNANTLLRLIAIFKLVKALTLIALGFGALHLLHGNNAGDSITQLVAHVGLRPGDHYLDQALARVAKLPPKDFRDLGIGSFIYAALFMTEGIGLWLMKRWAEWFTAIITASLVPLEIFEIHHHPTIAKVVVLLLNIAVVAYLVVRIRTHRQSER
jgi:uncharacterized membrane protein (DUF2068 family)